MNAFVRFSGAGERRLEANKHAHESIVKTSTPTGQQSISEHSPTSDRTREYGKTPVAKTAQPRDFRIALQLLEQASSGVDDLSERVKRSEAQSRTITEELERYKQMERQWLTNMESANLRFDEMELQISSLSEKLMNETNRSNTIEAKLEEVKEHLKISEERSTDLENDCIALHDSIVKAFGVESQAYQVLSVNVN